MSYKFITMKEANDGKHKYIVTLLNKETNRQKNIKFGAFGFSDFIQSKDIKKKELYDARHKVREDWTDTGTAGFWSKWILWNKPTLEASLQHTLKQFKLI